jgi:PBSX family phage terminase large subunit
MLSNSNERWVLVRQYLNSIKHSTFTELADMISNDDQLYSQFEIIDSRYEIRCIATGARLFCYGTRESKKSKGLSNITKMFFEEVDQIDEQDFDTMNEVLRKVYENTALEIWMAFNPTLKTHWIPQRWFNGGELLPEINTPVINNNAWILRTTYKDNPYVDKETIAAYEAYKEWNYARYKVICLGEWGIQEMGKLFIPDHYQTYNTSDTAAQGKGVIWADLAYGMSANADYTCIVKVMDRGDGNIYIDDYCLERNKTIEWSLDRICGMMSDNCNLVGIDGNWTQKSVLTQIISDYTKKNARAARIQPMNISLNENVNVLSYYWNMDKIKFPEHINNDSALEQLYAFEGVKTSNKHDDFPDALCCGIVFGKRQWLFR